MTSTTEQGTADVVVDGGRDARHLELIARLRRPAGEGQRAPEGAVAADGHDSVQPQQAAGGQGLVLTGDVAELLAAGGVEDGAALVDDVADAGGVHADEVAVDQSVPAAADAHAVDPPAQGGAHHGPHSGVHARGVAAAGQDADPLDLLFHMLPPDNVVGSPYILSRLILSVIVSFPDRSVKVL